MCMFFFYTSLLEIFQREGRIERHNGIEGPVASESHFDMAWVDTQKDRP